MDGRAPPPTPPGQCPSPPGRGDPSLLDCRNDSGLCSDSDGESGNHADINAHDQRQHVLHWGEEREGNDGSGVATEDNDDTDAEAGEYACDFLDVTLSQLWEGRFGRRTTTAKTMEMSGEDKHKEDVVLRSMFEMHCKGVRQEMRRGHCCRQPPLPEDEACPTWLSLLSLSDNASPRDVARTTATTEQGIHL